MSVGRCLGGRGHISVVVQHMARDAGVPLRLCMASVPAVTDALSYRFYTDSPFASFHEFVRAPILRSRIQYFGRQCTPSEDGGGAAALKALWPDWWLSPIRATRWDGLCDAFIRVAEIDPLRDEGEAYAAKLVAGGTRVTVKRYLGCPHTFMYLGFMDQKKAYDADAIHALKEAHGLR